MQNKNQLLKMYHELGIILRKGPEHPKGFLLKSGKKSDIYINIRDLIKYQAAWSYTIFCLSKLVGDANLKKKNSCILGVPTMGAVLAPIIAYQNQFPLAIIRQHKKDHGVGSEVEGTLNRNIVVIDDVITTGSSILEIENQYFPNNYDSLNIFVIVDREQHPFKKVYSLMTLEDIKKYRPKKGRKNENQG